jgi:hypothetical protein
MKTILDDIIAVKRQEIEQRLPLALAGWRRCPQNVDRHGPHRGVRGRLELKDNAGLGEMT